MRDFKEKFITLVLLVFIIIVFGGMALFCLDIFGIVKIPEKYSLINILYSNKEVVHTVKPNTENTNITENSNSDNTINNENNNSDIANQLEETTNPSLIVNSVQPQISENLESSKKFYYSQLDEYGKKIYDKLTEHKEDLKTGTYTIEFEKAFNELLQDENGADTLNNAFQLAVNSFMFDNPDIFYIDIPKIYILTEITTKSFSKTYRVSIGPKDGNYLYEEFQNRDNLDYAIDRVEEMKNYIMSNAVGSDYEKMKYVHDYLIENIEYYKSDKPTVYNVYGALLHKQSVCEGYAKTFKYILDNLGIPCIIVCGVGRNSDGETENHAWNYVELNGKWYAADLTWDDPIIIGNGTVNEDIKYRYFLKGSNSFFEDHLEDGAIIAGASFKYPELSVINY